MAQELKNVAGNFFDYENIKIKDDNTIIFNNAQFFNNKLKRLKLMACYYCQKNIEFKLQSCSEIYLPRISLCNIKKLNIYFPPDINKIHGMFDYVNLKNIYINKQLVSDIKNSVLMSSFEFVIPGDEIQSRGNIF